VDQKKFWSMIEEAWKSVGGKVALRRKLAEGKLSDEKAEALAEALDEVIPALRTQLDQLPKKELLTFDRILERKLYEIDRQEVQEHTDGSDDGFLYARGFIVAAGKEYYDAVNARPETALMDLECEEMCYLSWHLYREKFGEMEPSGICRESCSNRAAWPDLA
jgi:DNA-binding transcriptional ArsR family regulator